MSLAIVEGAHIKMGINVDHGNLGALVGFEQPLGVAVALII